MKNIEEKLIKNIHKKGATTNFEWYKERFDRGCLLIRKNSDSNTHNISEELFSDFIKMIKIVKDIFEDNWDIDFSIFIKNNKVYVTIKGITIHFPNITISNSRGSKHNIRDLFVTLNIYDRIGQLYISRIEGFRTTFTYEELCSDYSHSHLSDNTYKYFRYRDVFPVRQEFCLGIGEISISKMDFNGSDEFDSKIFTGLLVQLFTLVSWESLEGTPYRYMDKIRFVSASDEYIRYLSNTPDLSSIIDDLRGGIIRGYIYVPFVFKNNFFEIKEDKLIEAFWKLKNTPPDKFKQVKKILFGIYDDNKDAYIIPSSIPEGGKVFKEIEKQGVYLFRDKEFSLNVIYPNIKSNKDYDFDKDLTLNLKAVKYLKEKIEKDVNKKYLRERVFNY